jgi:hypothetical protein
LATATRGQQCCGDCNGDLTIAVNEVVTAVGYALNGCPMDGVCCGDCDSSGDVAVNELVTTVGNALDHCPGAPTQPPAGTPTKFKSPTKTPIPTKTETFTRTPIPSKTPTPTRAPTMATSCPFNFRTNNGTAGDPFCAYLGTVSSPACPGTVITVGAGWFGDGSIVTAVLVDGDGNALDFNATVTSVTAASIGFATIEGVPDPLATGAMTLPSKKQFSMHTNLLVGCSPLIFVGTFSAVLVGTENAVEAMGNGRLTECVDALRREARGIER